MSQELGLVRYDAMCSAIAACHGVDEAREIRSKARAFEVYAAQANNRDAERMAAEIRIRAERKVGELLKEMKVNGKRQGQGGNKIAKSDEAILVPRTLSDLGISPDQSSQWQKLAEIPEPQFEEAIKQSWSVPNTESIVNGYRASQAPPTPSIDLDALNAWGRMCDFERGHLFEKDPQALMKNMTEPMREGVLRLAPRLINWLSGFQK